MSVGLPGRLKSSSTPSSYAHLSMTLEMNSLPLSTLIVVGKPRYAAIRFSVLTTSSPLRLCPHRSLDFLACSYRRLSVLASACHRTTHQPQNPCSRSGSWQKPAAMAGAIWLTCFSLDVSGAVTALRPGIGDKRVCDCLASLPA